MVDEHNNDDEGDLERRIASLRQNKNAIDASSPDYIRVLKELIDALVKSYKNYKRVPYLIELIEVLREALEETATYKPDYHHFTRNLGLALTLLFSITREGNCLNEAVTLYRTALHYVPDEEQQVEYIQSLVHGLKLRSRHSGNTDDLKEAIRLQQHIVDHHAVVADYLNTLADLFEQLYEQTGTVSLLDEVIKIRRKSIDCSVPNTSPWRMLLSSLAGTLSIRYERRATQEDIWEAISLARKALEGIAPDEANNLDILYNNLAIILGRKYENFEEPEDLEETVKILKQLLSSISEDSSNYMAIYINLVQALSQYSDRQTLEEALNMCKIGFDKVQSYDSSWAGALAFNRANILQKLNSLGANKVLEEIFDNYAEACNIPNARPEFVFGSAYNWLRYACEKGAWGMAERATQFGIESFEALYLSQFFRDTKQSWLKEGFALFLFAAYASAKRGDIREAILYMEHGCARGLGEVLGRERINFSELKTRSPALYEGYQTLVNRQSEVLLSHTQTNSSYIDTLNNTEIELISEFREIISRIHVVLGTEDLFDKTSWTEIAQATKPGVPVVYLATLPWESMALILYRPSREENLQTLVLWLAQFTDDDLARILNGSPDSNVGWLLTLQRSFEQKVWKNSIEEITRQLGQFLMKDVVTYLKSIKVEKATLIPTAMLSILPLSATWYVEDGCQNYVLDQIYLNYAPSARSLGRCQQQEQTIIPSRFVGVAEPLPSSAKRLPFAIPEVVTVSGNFQQTSLFIHSQATRRNLLDVIEEANVLHLSCHSSNNWQSPLESGPWLANDMRLTVKDLLRLKLKQGRLAVLSSCETSLIGMDTPSEVIGLPAALLEAGYVGVLTCMWPISDASTALLMHYFYNEWRVKGKSPTVALVEAQKWLRDTTNAEKSVYFEKYLLDLSINDTVGNQIAELYAYVATGNPDERTYAHPYWWASFIITGV